MMKGSSDPSTSQNGLDVKPAAMSIISINVGGMIYTTTHETLTRHGTSMLSVMFNGSIPSTRDKDGNFFIDRDGKLFSYILNFLRSSTLNLPSRFCELEQLLCEADFYQIKPLVAALRGMKLGQQTLIRLNIGGRKYVTNKDTLLKYPESKLTNLFKPDANIPLDSEGCFFFDRDGELFRYILNFLRDGVICLPSGFSEYSQLIKEADFYGLTPLVDYLRTEKGWFIEVQEHCESKDAVITGSYGALDHVPNGIVKGEVSSNLRETELTRLQCADILYRSGWIFMGSTSHPGPGPTEEDETSASVFISDKWFQPG